MPLTKSKSPTRAEKEKSSKWNPFHKDKTRHEDGIATVGQSAERDSGYGSSHTGYPSDNSFTGSTQGLSGLSQNTTNSTLGPGSNVSRPAPSAHSPQQSNQTMETSVDASTGQTITTTV